MAFMETPENRKAKELERKKMQLRLKMVVDSDGGLWFDQACRFAPRRGLPVVLALFRRNPGRQGLVEIRCKRETVRLIRAALVDEALVGRGIFVQFQTVLREDITNLPECGRR